MKERIKPDSGSVAPLLKLLVFTLLVPGSVTLWLPFFVLYPRIGLRSFQAGGFTPAGILLIALGATGYLWCALDFAYVGRGTPAPIDPPKILVARGLYRFVRNPMYVSVMLILLGESLLFESLALLRYAVIVAVGFHLFVVLYEEPTLRKKFGASYEQYCKHVRRWIPRIPRAH